MPEFTVQVQQGQTVALRAKVNADNAEEALLLVADEIAPEPVDQRQSPASPDWLYVQVAELKERVTRLEES